MPSRSTSAVSPTAPLPPSTAKRTASNSSTNAHRTVIVQLERQLEALQREHNALLARSHRFFALERHAIADRRRITELAETAQRESNRANALEQQLRETHANVIKFARAEAAATLQSRQLRADFDAVSRELEAVRTAASEQIDERRRREALAFLAHRARGSIEAPDARHRTRLWTRLESIVASSRDGQRVVTELRDNVRSLEADLLEAEQRERVLLTTIERLRNASDRQLELSPAQHAAAIALDVRRAVDELAR